MTFANRFKRSLTLWAGFALVLSYWILAFLTDNNTLAEWVRVATIVYASAAAATYAPSFYRIFIEDTDTAGQRLILGAVLAFLGIAGSAIWLLLWRMSGFPVWMVQSAVNGFWLWCILLGAFFVLAAPRTRTEPPRFNVLRVGFTAALTVVLGYVIVVRRPDVQPMVAWLGEHFNF